MHLLINAYDENFVACHVLLVLNCYEAAISAQTSGLTMPFTDLQDLPKLEMN